MAGGSAIRVFFSLRAVVCGVATLVLVLFSSGWGQAQSVVRTGPDQIRVSAKNVPLATLLREFAREASVESVMVDPSVRSVPVTVETEEITPAKAIVEILEASGVNYAIWGGRGQAFRVYAGSPESRESLILSPPEELELPDRASSPRSPADAETASTSARGEATGGVPGEGRRRATAPARTGPPPFPIAPGRRSEEASPPRSRRSRAATAPGQLYFATDGAALEGRPTERQIGALVAILSSGLCLGLVLVGRPRDERGGGDL